MELLRIDSHFFPYFVINGVTILLWQLGRIMAGGRAGGRPARWEWKKVVKNNSYILGSLESLLIFPGALCQSCCLCSIIRVAENCDLSITNLFSSDLRRVLLAAFRDV